MENAQGKSCSTGCQSLMWWVTLMMAVIAVPCIGIIASMMWGSKGVGEFIVFVGACWISTWLGMRLMKNPRMSEKFDINKNP